MDPVTSPGPTTGEGGISACQAISSPPDQVASMVSSAIVRGPPRSHERDPRVNISEHRVDATPHPLESGAAHHGGEVQADEPEDGAQACPQGNVYRSSPWHAVSERTWAGPSSRKTRPQRSPGRGRYTGHDHSSQFLGSGTAPMPARQAPL